MPRIAPSVNGIEFYVYADDHNPPHVHAFYAEHEVLLVIASAEVYAGGLPRPQLAESQAWPRANQPTAMAAWNRLNP